MIPATVIAIQTGAVALPLHPLMAELPLWRRLVEAVGPSSGYGGAAYEAAESCSKVSANVGRLET